jgi:hypothetical protein
MPPWPRRLHIDRRIRGLALQSAVGEILLSILGMVLAAAGLLPPVEGAIAQGAIDIWAVLNAFGCCYRGDADRHGRADVVKPVVTASRRTLTRPR